MDNSPVPEGTKTIADKIVVVRGRRVLIDADLAAMYGVTTKRFNEQIKRNEARFPPDFSFLLEDQDFAILRSQFATSRFDGERHGGRRYRPRVFTEHGAIMAAMVLNSSRAIQMSVYVVRAFVKIRDILASNSALASRLELLEQSVAALDADTRKQFDQVYEAILGLMGSVPRKS